MMRKKIKIKRKVTKVFRFHYLTFISAVSISLISGFFSVYGLSNLFSESRLSVIIMGSCLELGKIIAISALYRYWRKLPLWTAIYIGICVFVLVIITSLGIYSYLSNSYQSTSNTLEISSKEIEIKNNEKINCDNNIKVINDQISSLDKRYNSLVDLRNSQEKRLDEAIANNRYSIIKYARTDIQNSSLELQKIVSSKNELTKKNEEYIKQKNEIEKNILKLSRNELTIDIGPLKYLSKLFNKDINKIVNILILVIICVFDPFAIMMFIVTNTLVMMKEIKKRKKRRKVSSKSKRRKII